MCVCVTKSFALLKCTTYFRCNKYSRISTHTSTIQSLKFLFYRWSECTFSLSKGRKHWNHFEFSLKYKCLLGGLDILSQSLLLFFIGIFHQEDASKVYCWVTNNHPRLHYKIDVRVEYGKNLVD